MRQQVALALGEFDGPEAAAALVKLAVDPEQTVANAAANSMAELKDPACADAILPLVGHAHAFVRMASLRALKELRRKDTLKPALDALRDVDAAVRVQAIGVIGFLKLEESIPALTSVTTDGDAHVRRAAVSALAFSHMKPAAESITRALADTDWMVREVAAETLGTNVNGVQAADPLISALSDEFWQVRLKAARSLGKMKVARAVPAIGACLAHPQANLRKEGAAALGEIADAVWPQVPGAHSRRPRSRGSEECALGDAADRLEKGGVGIVTIACWFSGSELRTRIVALLLGLYSRTLKHGASLSRRMTGQPPRRQPSPRYLRGQGEATIRSVRRNLPRWISPTTHSTRARPRKRSKRRPRTIRPCSMPIPMR